MESTNKPIDSIRVKNVVATIWPVDTKKGLRYRATFSRFYTVDEETHYSDSYFLSELAAHTTASALAEKRIQELLEPTS